MWWTLALLSAVASLARNLVMRDLGNKLDEYVNVLGRFIFILPFALTLTLYHGIPETSPTYWVYSVLAGAFVAVSTMFLSQAFKRSDVALVVALWKLNIIFLLLLELVFLRAHMSSLSLLGVLVTVCGAYLLNVEKARESLWKPFAVLGQDKGMRYALLSAIFLAPSFFFFKLTVDMTDPFYPAFTNYVFAVLFTLPAVLKISRHSYGGYLKHWKGFVGMGLFACLTTVLATVGYKESFATYVEVVKQAEVLMALIAGVFLFKERQRVRSILPGCLVMITGICIVILGS